MNTWKGVFFEKGGQSWRSKKKTKEKKSTRLCSYLDLSVIWSVSSLQPAELLSACLVIGHWSSYHTVSCAPLSGEQMRARLAAWWMSHLSIRGSSPLRRRWYDSYPAKLSIDIISLDRYNPVIIVSPATNAGPEVSTLHAADFSIWLSFFQCILHPLTTGHLGSKPAHAKQFSQLINCNNSVNILFTDQYWIYLIYILFLALLSLHHRAIIAPQTFY